MNRWVGVSCKVSDDANVRFCSRVFQSREAATQKYSCADGWMASAGEPQPYIIIIIIIVYYYRLLRHAGSTQIHTQYIKTIKLKVSE